MGGVLGGKSKSSGPSPEQLEKQRKQEAKIKAQQEQLDAQQREAAEAQSGAYLARKRRSGRALLSQTDELGNSSTLGNG